MDKLDKIMEAAMDIVDANGISNITGTDSHIEADCEYKDVLYHLVLNGNINNLDDIKCDCGQEMCAHRLAFVIELNKRMENSKALMLENAFNGSLSWQGIKDFVELAINYNEELYNYFLDMILFEENGGIDFKGDLEYERIDDIFSEYSQTGFILRKNFRKLIKEINEEIDSYGNDAKSIRELSFYLLKLMTRYQYDWPIEFYGHVLTLFEGVGAKLAANKVESKAFINDLISHLKDPETIFNEILIGDLLITFAINKVQAKAIQKIIKERIDRLIPVVRDNQSENLPVEISNLCISLNRLNIVTRTQLNLSLAKTAKMFYQLQPRAEIYHGVYELLRYYLDAGNANAFIEFLNYTFNDYRLQLETPGYLKDLFSGVIGAIGQSSVTDKDDYYTYISQGIMSSLDHEDAVRLLWELDL